MVTTDVTNHSTVTMRGEHSLGQFTAVRIALSVEKYYTPSMVSVGLLGNVLCFITLVFTSLRKTSSCVYMAAIAVLDSLILTLGLCVMISLNVGHTVFFLSSGWNCGFFYLLFYFSIHSDVLIVLAMTVDRFIVVKFPLKAQRLCTPKSAICVMIGIGIFALALNFHVFFNRRLVPAGRLDDPLRCWYPKGEIENFMQKIYTIMDATVYSFIPFVSLITFNLLIIRELKRSRTFTKQFTERPDGESSSNAKNIRDGSHSTGVDTSTRTPKTTDSRPGSSRKAQANTNITLMLLVVSFCFLALSSPLVIVLLFQRYSAPPETLDERAQAFVIRTYARITMFSNHGLNFLLYSISGRRFRQELTQLLTRLGRHFC